MFKFGWLPDGTHEVEYHYPNVWSRETTSGPERLVIAPEAEHIALLQDLVTAMPAPYWLLYVLTVSRGEGAEGRYQSSTTVSRQDLREFLTRHGGFLSGDGRCNLWLASENRGGQLIYDKHNMIYAYGPLDAFTDVLRAKGLREELVVRFPVPHAHRYNKEFDKDSANVLAEREWIYSPLLAQDDDRPV